MGICQLLIKSQIFWADCYRLWVRQSSSVSFVYSVSHSHYLSAATGPGLLLGICSKLWVVQVSSFLFSPPMEWLILLMTEGTGTGAPLKTHKVSKVFWSGYIGHGSFLLTNVLIRASHVTKTKENGRDKIILNTIIICPSHRRLISTKGRGK